jgi:hypothetical protein
MLLQGSRAVERPGQATPALGEQATVLPEPGRRVVPQPPAPVARRVYPPIDWSTPSLGRAVSAGLGGISRTVVLLMVLGAVLVGTAMAVALVVTGVVGAFGFDASSGY